MKLGILLIILGCFGVVVAVMNRHPVLCGGGILILVLGAVRIKTLRSKAKATLEESKG